MLMISERSRAKTLVVAAAFLVSFTSLELVALIPGYLEFFRGGPELWWWIENAVRPLVPVVGGLLLLHGARPRRWGAALGMDRPFLPALALATALCAPALFFPVALGVSPNLATGFADQLFGAGIWPLAEEINFRGFAFGQIYSYSGLGFWPAALLTSALFGIGHMTNAAAAGLDLGGQLANAGIVGASALGLAWIYFRWGRNLWLVFFLHALGNFAGSLYMSGEVAVGDRRFLTLLAVTLILALGLTVLRDRFRWSKWVWERVAGEQEGAIDA